MTQTQFMIERFIAKGISIHCIWLKVIKLYSDMIVLIIQDLHTMFADFQIFFLNTINWLKS